jgi:alpha-tubulin suppressor-like RCC1 family protein
MGAFTRVLAVSLLAFACVARGEVLGRSQDENTADAGSGTGGVGALGGAGETSQPENAVVSSVALGTSHSAAISAGTLYAWGLNDAGELGLGDTTDRHVPTALTSDLTFVSVSAGGDYTCVLDDVGAVYCFGANDRGQLGQGDRTERLVPTRVALPVAARALSDNFEHVCALLADASLYCWGQNFEGEIGQNDSPPASNQDDTAVDVLSPIQVAGTDWSDVSAGDGFTCGIRFDGTLWCWGRNSGHQLGPDDTIQIRHPIQVGSDTDWLHVESGQQFSFALKQDHSLWCWGLNVASSTNDGFPLGIDATELDTPTELGSATDWVSFAVRVFHTCAVNRASELWCWGRNTEGQLGTGDTNLRTTPTHVADDVAEVAVSWFTTCTRSNAGHIACAGANDNGEIGDGTTDRPLHFTDVTPPAP